MWAGVVLRVRSAVGSPPGNPAAADLFRLLPHVVLTMKRQLGTVTNKRNPTG